MRKDILACLLSCIVLFYACGGSKGEDPGPTPPTEAIPGKAVLSLPAKDAPCTTGVVGAGSQSSVTFTWAASEKTDGYELTIKNLETGISSTRTSTGTALAVTLSINTPYSWFVTSKITGSTIATKSEVWKFYNSGPGILSYAPYPAEILSPTPGQIIAAATKVTLDWNGADADNDIVGYDVYFGTSSSPALIKSNSLESILADVSVTSGAMYYWRVITKDSKGNTSDSGLMEFKVN